LEYIGILQDFNKIEKQQEGKEYNEMLVDPLGGLALTGQLT